MTIEIHHDREIDKLTELQLVTLFIFSVWLFIYIQFYSPDSTLRSTINVLTKTRKHGK